MSFAFTATSLHDMLISRADDPYHHSPVGISPESSVRGLSPALSIALDTIKHERFYLPDGNVIFKVDDVLYNVHRYFFQRYSEVFAAMFTLPPPAGCPAEGATDDNPIVLDEVEPRDFDRLLSVFYPTHFNKEDAKTVEEWTSILQLASRWDFISVRERAIERLFPITTPIDKIVLGHAYDLPSWLLPAYTDVCCRDDPLTHAEGRRLGLDRSISVGLARHAVRGGVCRYSRNDVESKIKKVLDLPPPAPAV